MGLRALIWVPDTGAPFGGQVVQMKMTARHLAEAGVDATLTEDAHPSFTGVDVVHGYGLSAAQVREARKRRIPVCLSTVYWSKAYMTGRLQPRPLLEEVRVRSRAAVVLSRAALRGRHVSKAAGYVRWEAETTAAFEAADLLLPNSKMEASQIVADLGVTTPMHVVPNGVDPALFANTTPWKERAGVISVGRIEPHKNQLRLIEALKGVGLKLTLVGDAHPHHLRYAREVERAAAEAGNVDMIPRLPHEELIGIFNQHRVHALPSGFETTGLVSLEAALCGCNVVSTDVGYAREYLGDDAWYCDPYVPWRIQGAISVAHGGHETKPGLAERVRAKYTWRHAAEATLAGYESLLSIRG